MAPVTFTIEQMRDVLQGLRLLLMARLKEYRECRCYNIALAEDIARNEQEVERIETLLKHESSQILNVGDIERELHGQTKRD